MQIESDVGTVRYAYRFWVYGFLIYLLFTLFCGGLALAGQGRLVGQQVGQGLWPLLFCDLVIQCMERPDAAMGLCCLPIQIQAKWYPPILLLIFCCFFNFDLSLFAGSGVGYLHAFGYMSRVDLSIPKAAEWEKRHPFKNFSEKQSFVKAGGGLAGEIIPTSQANTGMPMPGQPSSSPGFSSFSGKGTSLGSGSASASSVPTSISSSDSVPTDAQRSEAATRNIAQQSALLKQVDAKRKKEAKSEEAKDEDLEEEGHSMLPEDLNNKSKKDKYLTVAGDSLEED